MTDKEAKLWLEANYFDGDSYGFVDGDEEHRAMYQAVKALENQIKWRKLVFEALKEDPFFSRWVFQNGVFLSEIIKWPEGVWDEN